MKKLNVFSRLTAADRYELDWKLLVLIALFVSVFGIFANQSGKKAHAQTIARSWQDEPHDPYDILSESVEERSSGIETGL
jgi:hypothetical protein